MTDYSKPRRDIPTMPSVVKPAPVGTTKPVPSPYNVNPSSGAVTSTDGNNGG